MFIVLINRSKRLTSVIGLNCLICFLLTGLQAKDSLPLVNNLQVGGYMKHGTIMPHHESISYALNSNISGFEMALTTDSYGRSAWDSLYRFPCLGIGYNYTTLGNKEIFGSSHGVFGFVDVPFIRYPGNFNVNYQFSVGLAYLTKSFDVVENPLNLAISSGLNLYVDLKFTARYSINRKNVIAVGFGLTHFSNGKMGTPNLGLNSFNLALGYHHEIMGAREKHRIIHSSIPFSKHSGDIVVSAGLKVDDQASTSKYLISTVVADYIFAPGPKYAFGGGTDLFYDQSLGPNVAEPKGQTYKQLDLVQLGLHAGIYARYGKMRIAGHVGYYVIAQYYKYTKFYTRIGMRYSISNRVFLNLSLKAHYAIADYVEWGIGYRIK